MNNPKRRSRYLNIESFAGHLGLSQDELIKSPRIRSSFDWETERLQQEIVEKIDTISSIDKKSTALQQEFIQMGRDINSNTDMLKINNDLLLELLNLLKLQASQAYFWSSAWISSEREAQIDIEKGDVHSFETSDQIIKFLHDD